MTKTTVILVLFVLTAGMYAVLDYPILWWFTGTRPIFGKVLIMGCAFGFTISLTYYLVTTFPRLFR